MAGTLHHLKKFSIILFSEFIVDESRVSELLIKLSHIFVVNIGHIL